MPSFETTSFGKLSYERDSALDFPCGLPGFEDRRLFLILNFEDSKPLLFLQSLEDPRLCFITLPILAVDPQYHLRVSSEDLARLDLPRERQPLIGRDVLCLTILSLQESGPTANSRLQQLATCNSETCPESMHPTNLTLAEILFKRVC